MKRDKCYFLQFARKAFPIANISLKVCENSLEELGSFSNLESEFGTNIYIVVP
ncbi:hypothetical protein CPK_ORF00964 [Chlamydia pneumoniae LPCoLN]|nr:hypothetical protein CPK_ORF00964 [Chlamydia pneumoniae LPCoLN]